MKHVVSIGKIKTNKHKNKIWVRNCVCTTDQLFSCHQHHGQYRVFQSMRSLFLQVVRLWDSHGLQGHGGHDHVGALRYPALGCPVEGGPLGARLLQLWVTGGVQVQHRQLEGDRPGGFVKAAKRSGHPEMETKFNWCFLIAIPSNKCCPFDAVFMFAALIIRSLQSLVIGLIFGENTAWMQGIHSRQVVNQSQSSIVCNYMISHRLKHLYSGRSVRASGSGMLSLSVSARSGSLRMACSHGEW